MSFEIDNKGLRFKFNREEQFAKDIRSRVNTYFRESKKTKYGNYETLIKALLLLGLTIFFYIKLLTFSGENWILPFGIWTLYGLFSLFLVLNVSHDAAHFALVKNKRLNSIIHLLTLNILGVNSYLWSLRHLNSHHVFPNINGCDADIDHNPFLRLSPNHPFRSYQKWQHLYAPFIYMLVNIHSIIIQDPIYLFKSRLANMKNIKHPWFEILLFILGKAQYFIINLILPIIFLPFPWWQTLIAYFLVTAIISLFFVLPLIGTHFNDKVDFPIADINNELDTSYFKHQVESSLDWNPTDRLSCFLIGGLNAHVAHHMFPDVCHVHYPKISEIIQSVLKDYKIDYKVTDFGGAIKSHFNFLYIMGNENTVHNNGNRSTSPL